MINKLLENEKYEEALKLLVAPKTEYEYYQKIVCLFSLKRLKEAKIECELALELAEKNYYDIIAIYVSILMELEEDELAIKVLEEELEMPYIPYKYEIQFNASYDELLKNQSEVIKLLNNAKRKNKLSHAYLFEGDSGTGTLEAARYFAMMLLCEKEQPCLTCNTCERIQYNSHMNVVLIEPFGDVIRKEQVENLMHDFSMTSLEKGPQV